MTTDVRIGLIVPCDLTLDHEYPRYLDHRATVHITRTGFHEGGLTREFIEGVASHEEVGYAAHSLTKIDPAVITFACTSGSFLHGAAGEKRLRSVIEAAGGRNPQTTSGSLLDAVAALGVASIGIATPYPPAVGNLLGDYLEDSGIRVLARHHSELYDVIDPINTKAVRQMAYAAAAGSPEAIFLACTGVPTLDEVEGLEAELEFPILTANQVTMWAAAGAAGASLAPLNHILFHMPWKPR